MEKVKKTYPKKVRTTYHLGEKDGELVFVIDKKAIFKGLQELCNKVANEMSVCASVPNFVESLVFGGENNKIPNPKCYTVELKQLMKACEIISSLGAKEYFDK